MYFLTDHTNQFYFRLLFLHTNWLDQWKQKNIINDIEAFFVSYTILVSVAKCWHFSVEFRVLDFV